MRRNIINHLLFIASIALIVAVTVFVRSDLQSGAGLQRGTSSATAQAGATLAVDAR